MARIVVEAHPIILIRSVAIDDDFELRILT